MYDLGHIGSVGSYREGKPCGYIRANSFRLGIPTELQNAYNNLDTFLQCNAEWGGSSITVSANGANAFNYSSAGDTLAYGFSLPSELRGGTLKLTPTADTRVTKNGNKFLTNQDGWTGVYYEGTHHNGIANIPVASANQEYSVATNSNNVYAGVVSGGGFNTTIANIKLELSDWRYRFSLNAGVSGASSAGYDGYSELSNWNVGNWTIRD